MTRVERVAVQLACTVDEAQRYLDLRDEGYSSYEAKILAGLADPPAPAEHGSELDYTSEEEEAFNSMRGELR